MEDTRKRQAIIKKLNKIYKKGYMPEREKEKYSELHAEVVNCFGHACFNLSNKILDEFALHQADLMDFFRNFNGFGIHNYFKESVNRIEKVGLKINVSSLKEPVKKNQWKIAYYVMNNIFSGSDLHFMIQAKDGKWYSKLGKNPGVEVFDKLPKVFHGKYKLSGIYKITNPYAKLEEDNMEM